MSSSVDAELPILAARDVSKTFRVPEEQVHTLKERVLHPRKRIRRHAFHSLQGVSFAVGRGEFFGIAGRNGSGKSTLLKCLAGIYACEGDIWCRGRLSTLIELGVGFNLDLAARDNVITNGIMMGLTPREARRRFDSVIEFAELEDFKDLKLKNYSSGMQVRLAFAVAIQVDAEIMLIDEILAVGDASFQQKCLDVFDRMRGERKTVVIVTHDMAEMSRFCDRALLLEQGKVVCSGDPQEVGDRYLDLNFSRDHDPTRAAQAHGSAGDARVVEMWVEDESGERRSAAAQGQRITVRTHLEFAGQIENPTAKLEFLNREHIPILVLSTEPQHQRSGVFRAGERATFSFTFDNVLAPGRYSPVLHLACRGSAHDLIGHFDSSHSFVVTSQRALGGLVDVPVEVTIERSGAGVAEQLTA
jgi:ABC-type polysaccharide/polyol phosphate transport system ATPase subunit